MQKVLFSLALFFVSTLSQFTDDVSPTNVTPTSRPNPCLFGGVCDPGNLDDCICLCAVNHYGTLCEKFLTKIDGTILYKKEFANSTVDIDTGLLNQRLQVPANTAHTFELNEPRFNFTEIIITFSYYIERPASWTNYTDVLALQPPFETLLQDPSLTEAVFNSTDDVLFLSVTLDVDECRSNWTDCHPSAFCINRNPGFDCVCTPEYEGDGVECTPVFCLLSDAPKAPSLSNRIFFDSNGTAIPDPGPSLPYGTSIRYECIDNYELVDGNDNPLGLQSIACQNAGWGRFQESSCAMTVGFQIALGMTIASCVIIVIVLGAFATHYCLKAEKRARVKNDRTGQPIPFENVNFDEF